jgi:hypothetical protein
MIGEERTISTILSTRWVPKARKHIVKLAFPGERAEEVWMTEKQLDQLERCFLRTPHGHSTQHATVTGIWNGRGYYAYARLDRREFIPPEQCDLSDLIDVE